MAQSSAKFREGTKSPTSFYVNPSVERGSFRPSQVCQRDTLSSAAINLREEYLFSREGGIPVQTKLCN